MEQLNIRTEVNNPLPYEGMIFYRYGVEHKLVKQLSQTDKFKAIDLDRGVLECIDTLFEVEISPSDE